jgi:hypothetical protein
MVLVLTFYYLLSTGYKDYYQLIILSRFLIYIGVLFVGLKNKCVLTELPNYNIMFAM